MIRRLGRKGRPMAAARVLSPVALLLALLAACSHPPASVVSGGPVAGLSYQVCSEQAQYLTSPWSYDALASGSRSYTVSQYKALPGYGSKLPPLPSYIA